ncbi:MAG: HepT-like ribonuclease domain-containing protein [Promethearchaeota archaeon]
MTKHEDLPYFNHILDAINDIEESVRNISKEKFERIKDIKDANIRRIEIIGGAAKNISSNIEEKYKEIKWNKIIGTRDKMIHHYFGVNLDIVWAIIKKDIPDLKKKILKVIRDLKKD